MRADKGDDGAKGGSNIGAEDIVPGASSEVSGKRLGIRSVVGAEVENATSYGKNNSTKVWVSGTTKANDFATEDPAFLGVKFESDKVSIEDVGRGSGLQVEGVTCCNMRTSRKRR